MNAKRAMLIVEEECNRALRKGAYDAKLAEIGICDNPMAIHALERRERVREALRVLNDLVDKVTDSGKGQKIE